MRQLASLLKYYLGSDRDFAQVIRHVTGFYPGDLEIYRLAFRHSSVATEINRFSVSADCNERLEFLGDSILGSVVAEYLYKRYPTKSEGYLTEMRSKIVGRNSLNELGMKMGLEQLLEYNEKRSHFHHSYSGNTLEALVGAIFLDQGYERTKEFIIQRLITPHFDLRQLEDQNLNFKSQLLEYLQKNKYPMPEFRLVHQRPQGAGKLFTVECVIYDLVLGTGTDMKKKKAEQKASQHALENLHLLTDVPQLTIAPSSPHLTLPESSFEENEGNEFDDNEAVLVSKTTDETGLEPSSEKEENN